MALATLMPGRPWQRTKIGPRHPIEPLHNEHEFVADPANGEKVLRCRECGRPGLHGRRIYTFGLTLHGRTVGVYRLCDQCFESSNPRDPRDADPLDVTAA